MVVQECFKNDCSKRNYWLGKLKCFLIQTVIEYFLHLIENNRCFSYNRGQSCCLIEG